MQCNRLRCNRFSFLRDNQEKEVTITLGTARK
jgi:hypothetical protein